MQWNDLKCLQENAYRHTSGQETNGEHFVLEKGTKNIFYNLTFKFFAKKKIGLWAVVDAGDS